MLDADMIGAIREAFKAEKARDLRLSDEVLSLVIEKNDQWDDLEDEQRLKFLETAEEQAAKVAVADPAITQLVKKIDGSFEQEIDACVDAAAKVKTSAVDIYAQMRRVFTKQEMDEMPIPNTDAEHVSGNQKPDRVKRMDQTGKPITIVWSNDFISAMPQGKRFEEIIDNVKKEQKAPGSVPAMNGKSKAALASMLSDAQAKRNTLRSIFKRAINVHHQFEAIAAMPEVDIAWIPGTKDNAIVIPEKFGTGEIGSKPIKATQSPKPIWICPKGDFANGRDFSITQMLSFKVPMALAEGGTMADLTATATRGAIEKPEDDTGTGEEMPADTAQEVLSQFYHWLNKMENQTQLLKKISNRKADADGNDWLDLVGSLDALLHPIAKKYNSAYQELINKDDAQAA